MAPTVAFAFLDNPSFPLPSPFSRSLPGDVIAVRVLGLRLDPQMLVVQDQQHLFQSAHEHRAAIEEALICLARLMMSDTAQELPANRNTITYREDPPDDVVWTV